MTTVHQRFIPCRKMSFKFTFIRCQVRAAMEPICISARAQNMMCLRVHHHYHYMATVYYPHQV